MLYIWKRLINIVFIRKYEVKNQNLPPWYELSTVTFPQPVANVLVPWRLDIWTNSKLRKGVSLFRDKTTDLQNQTLRVVAFQHLPGVTKSNISSTDGYRATIVSKDLESNITYFFKGVEVEILYAISKAMNFICELYEPENVETELWGRKLPGGVYTGVIGEMVRIKADIAIGDLYYTSFLLDVMDLSSPYNTECLTFLVPESLTDVSWKTLIRPFHGITWGILLLCLIFCIVTFHLLAKYHQRTMTLEKDMTRKKTEAAPKTKHQNIINLFIIPEAEKKDPNVKYTMLKQQLQSNKEVEEATGLYQFTEPVNSVLYTYSMLLLVSLPKLPLGWSLRMFTGWYWLYCLLLATSYRASMTAILAKPAPKVTIDTLQELVASRLTYGGWGEINKDFFKMSTDPTIQMISKNFVMVNNSDEAVDRVADATFAFYENAWYLKEAAVKRQQKFYFKRSSLNQNTSSDGLDSISGLNDRTLHIMRDCIINMPVSIGLQKNSPLTPRFNKYTNRILEAGLITKWLDDAMQKVLNAEVHKEDTESSKALMNAKKFSGALVALAIGYFVSTCTLIGEILYFNYVVKKKPDFNKYQLIIRAKKAK
nr:unnamed protein product [Callosobruchus analis]